MFLNSLLHYNYVKLKFSLSFILMFVQCLSKTKKNIILYCFVRTEETRVKQTEIVNFANKCIGNIVISI